MGSNYGRLHEQPGAQVGVDFVGISFSLLCSWRPEGQPPALNHIGPPKPIATWSCAERSNFHFSQCPGDQGKIVFPLEITTIQCDAEKRLASAR